MSQEPPLISPNSPSSSTISSHSPLSQEPAPLSSAGSHDPPSYRGVRKRKWGKWVAEIRVPHKRSRIWLGSYFSAQAAAAAFDVASYCLRGPSARMNLPHFLPPSLSTLSCTPLSPKSVQKLALAAGSAVDQAFGAPSSDKVDAHSTSATHSAASSSSSSASAVGTSGERSFAKPPRLSIAPAPAALSSDKSPPAERAAQGHWMIGAKLEVSPNPTIAQLADAMLLAPPSPKEERYEEDSHVEDLQPSDSSLWQF